MPPMHHTALLHLHSPSTHSHHLPLLLVLHRMHYTMLAWLPSYFTEVLHLENLGDAAHTSVFPPLAGIVCSVLAGPIADKLIMSGAPLPIVRKVTQVRAAASVCCTMKSAAQAHRLHFRLRL